MQMFSHQNPKSGQCPNRRELTKVEERCFSIWYFLPGRRALPGSPLRHNIFRGLFWKSGGAEGVPAASGWPKVPHRSASPPSSRRETGYIFRAQQDVADPLTRSPAPLLAQAKLTGWISVEFSHLLKNDSQDPENKTVPLVGFFFCV